MAQAQVWHNFSCAAPAPFYHPGQPELQSPTQTWGHSPACTSPDYTRSSWSSACSTGSSTAGCMALTAYTSLFYDEDLHGPYATGLKRNPFTPGLDPVQAPCVTSITYAVQDPLKDKYPAQRAQDDPLNWISDALFRITEQRTQLTAARAPLRSLSAK